MGKTLIDVDDDLLAWAGQILGTGTKKETVNTALREVVRRDVAAKFLQFVAERHRVTLLHYDTDFDLIAKVSGQDTQWVVPQGSLPTPEQP
jgi:Arc/MetJ family transcription regulator